MCLGIAMSGFDPDKSPVKTGKRRRCVMLLALVALVACAPPLPPVADQTQPPPQPEVVVLPPPEPKPTAPAAAVMEKKPAEAKPAPEAKRTDEAEELFFQALRNIKERTPTSDLYQRANQSFATLFQKYPNGRWSDIAHLIMGLLAQMPTQGSKPHADDARLKTLLDEKASHLLENERLQEELRTLHDKYKADVSALQQENDHAKKELRGLHEKYKAELTASQQENEQLKKDIQLLKDLELKLEKREKQLR